MQDGELEDAKQKIKDLEEKNASLEAAELSKDLELEEAKRKIKDLEVPYAALKSQLKEMQNVSIADGENIAELEGDLDKANKKIANLERELEEANNKVEAVHVDLNKLKFNNRDADANEESVRKMRDALGASERKKGGRGSISWSHSSGPSRVDGYALVWVIAALLPGPNFPVNDSNSRGYSAMQSVSTYSNKKWFYNGIT